MQMLCALGVAVHIACAHYRLEKSTRTVCMPQGTLASADLSGGGQEVRVEELLVAVHSFLDTLGVDEVLEMCKALVCVHASPWLNLPVCPLSSPLQLSFGQIWSDLSLDEAQFIAWSIDASSHPVHDADVLAGWKGAGLCDVHPR